jgi:hypothetical protein
MTTHFGAYLLLLAATSGSTQPAAIAPGDIRCSGCALTGQKAGSVAFDESQIEFVANPVVSFDDGQTFRTNVLARVLNAAPLVLEILDSRHQMLDRHLQVVAEDPDNGRDPATCGGPERISAVDLASRPVVSTLRLNDIVSGAIMMRADERMPRAVRAGTPMLTNVRKVSTRTRFFHATAIPPHCINRSGRLIVRDGPESGESTVVYNDGSIYHRNAANATFTRERLSPAELSDLMRAFRATNFNAIATTFPESRSGDQRSLTLIGARYQRVVIDDGDRRLTPLLTRLDAIAARAMSRATYVLKRGNAIPLDVRPWPYPAIDLARFADSDLRRSAAAPDAWRQRVPDDFLKSLPADAAPSERPGLDGNRALYFSQAGKLYRVARPFQCTARTCSFRDLTTAQVAESASADPFQPISGRFWPRTVKPRLRDVPPDGLAISKQEYDRHRAIYLPLLKQRTLGVSYIDDGVFYGQVRLCQIDAGADTACDVRLPWPSARR